MVRLQEQMTAALRKRLAGGAARVPEGGALVWGWFADLCTTRAQGNPISYAEIEAYARLYRWPVEPRHVEMIRALDRVWLEAARGPAPAQGQPPASYSPPPVTAAAFDVVFG